MRIVVKKSLNLKKKNNKHARKQKQERERGRERQKKGLIETKETPPIFFLFS